MDPPRWLDRLAIAALVLLVTLVLLFDDPNWEPATRVDDAKGAIGLLTIAVVAIAVLRWRRRSSGHRR